MSFWLMIYKIPFVLYLKVTVYFLKTWFVCSLVSPFSVNATRECYPNSTWAPTTYYAHCLCNSTNNCMQTDQEDRKTLEISIIIYLVGKGRHLETKFVKVVFLQVISSPSLPFFVPWQSSCHSGKHLFASNSSFSPFVLLELYFKY